MNDHIPEHDLALPAAQRYAEAVSIAATAQTKIDALTEQITDHEWHRRQAEGQADALREIVDLNGGRLILSTDAAPGEDVRLLIDLHDGAVWSRKLRYGGSDDPNYWVRAETGGNPIQYEWPLPDAGPFVAAPDDWHQVYVARQAKQREDDEIAARALIRSRDGYVDPDATTWSQPALHEALARVLTALDRKWMDAGAEKQAAQQKVHELTRELESLRPVNSEVTS